MQTAASASRQALRRKVAQSTASSTSGHRPVLAVVNHVQEVQRASRRRTLSSTTSSRAKNFDSAALVMRLEGEGLTRRQAVGTTEALEEVLDESINTMSMNLVTRADAEKNRYTNSVDLARLRSELTLLEKQDFSLLKAENERLLSEVERLKQRLREEVSRASSSPTGRRHIPPRWAGVSTLPAYTNHLIRSSTPTHNAPSDHPYPGWCTARPQSGEAPDARRALRP